MYRAINPKTCLSKPGGLEVKQAMAGYSLRSQNKLLFDPYSTALHPPSRALFPRGPKPQLRQKRITQQRPTQLESPAISACQVAAQSVSARISACHDLPTPMGLSWFACRACGRESLVELNTEGLDDKIPCVYLFYIYI